MQSAKLNYYYSSDNTALQFEEYIAILTPDCNEDEFNEDCICDGLVLRQTIELPEGNYIELPTNRLLKPSDANY